jgi:maleate cis-trans isomerase
MSDDRPEWQRVGVIIPSSNTTVEVDRADPTQVSGSCGNLERSGFASGSEILRRLLQRRQNA